MGGSDGVDHLRLRERYGTWLLALLRQPICAPLLGWLLAHLTGWLPVEKLAETETLIAFFHPQPSDRVHILLVPKRSRKSLADLSEDDADSLVDLIRTVQALVARFGLDESGYRLVVNGGRYQDVAQVHFHLTS